MRARALETTMAVGRTHTVLQFMHSTSHIGTHLVHTRSVHDTRLLSCQPEFEGCVDPSRPQALSACHQCLRATRRGLADAVSWAFDARADIALSHNQTTLVAGASRAAWRHQYIWVSGVGGRVSLAPDFAGSVTLISGRRWAFCLGWRAEDPGTSVISGLGQARVGGRFGCGRGWRGRIKGSLAI